MIDCETCSISDVCKMAESIKQTLLYADVSLTNCKIKSALNVSVSVAQPVASPMPIPQPQPKVVREYPNFRQASDEVKQAEEQKSIKVIPAPNYNPNPEIGPLDRALCESCKTETTPDDIKICQGPNCSRLTCSECGTEHQGKRYCQECYDNLPGVRT